jgi:glycosyltransferase involved in cell wall biosynthesis
VSGGRLRVGFLHVGRERSGVRRYGRILAEEAGRHADLEVIEVDAGARDASLRDLARAGRALRAAEVVQVQWKLADWGPRTGGLPRTELVLATAGRPAVVTLHDVVERHGLRERRLSASAVGMRRLGRRAAALVVHLDEERRRLDGMVPAGSVSVIPHFVEQRPPLPAGGEARRALGLEGRRVISLLGYVVRRKGHALVIDALPELPDDVVALFVGSVIEGRDHVARALEERARELGVADRVRFCGFVPDDDLPLYLAATHVALCPFSDMSASGALSTWISSGRPIVASDLPAMREYEARSPGALRLFAPHAPGPFAERVREALAAASDAPDPLVVRLGEQLSTPRAVQRYAALYRAALGGPAARDRAREG